MMVLHIKNSLTRMREWYMARLGLSRLDQVQRGNLLQWVLVSMVAAVSALSSMDAAAVPAFARQTGQNCLACHAGGQFPELTPYGRMFKLTGFTIGQRSSMPLAVMAVFTANQIKSTPLQQDVTTNGDPTFNTASLFFGGKLTDNIGLLAQYTYSNSYNYASSGASGPNNLTGGPMSGQAGSDNTDLRYAQHLISDNNDLIYGFTFNNNPGVEDVWNSSAAWGYGVVPGSNNGDGGGSPILNGGLGQQAVGAGAYLYWNKTIYAELSGYRTGDGVFSFLTQGFCKTCAGGTQTRIAGTNPYARLALTHEWGANNVMLGYTYFDVNEYEASPFGGSSGPTDEYRDNMVDFQYQYLLDPVTFTLEASDINENVYYGSAGNVSDSDSLFRAKASFVWEAKYGATLSYFDGYNSMNNPGASLTSNFSSQLGTSGWTPEIFWIPIQNVRVGYQYTMYNSIGGAYSGNLASNAVTGYTPTKASDYNTSLFYVWAAF